jgi:hypothetical protein
MKSPTSAETTASILLCCCRNRANGLALDSADTMLSDLGRLRGIGAGSRKGGIMQRRIGS